MARPRTPTEKAALTGRNLHDPARFSERKEPETKALGKASDFLDQRARKAWDSFKREMPWLMESDRTLVEIACNLRARLMSGEEVGVQALGQLRMCVSAMGGTPADRSKVMVPDGEPEDPEDRFFQ
jgi:hypothetical protein